MFKLLKHSLQIANSGRRIKTIKAALVATLSTVLITPLQAGIDSGPAPDFTLASNVGENLRLAEQHGDVVMLNFWASWCAPCREEMPHLNALNDEYKDLGFTLFGVNVDENSKDAKRAIDKLKVAFPVLFDSDNSVAELFKVDAMPTTIIIDRDGQIKHLHRGYKKGYEDDYREQVGKLVLQ